MSIYDQDDCVFCLESLQRYYDPSSKNELFTCNEILNTYNLVELTDDLYEIYLRQYSIDNECISLECKHVFHLDCFFMYLKNVYRNYTTSAFDSNVFLQCPLCRQEVSKRHVTTILQMFRELNDIDDNLITITERLRAKILYKKVIMYTKKIFGKNNMSDVYAYNRLNIMYDETTEFERRVRQNIRDVKYIRDNIDKIIFFT